MKKNLSNIYDETKGGKAIVDNKGNVATEFYTPEGVHQEPFKDNWHDNEVYTKDKKTLLDRIKGIFKK